MPAHKDRRSIYFRLWPEELEKLEELCRARRKATGDEVSRSTVLRDLIADAHDKLEGVSKKKPRKR